MGIFFVLCCLLAILVIPAGADGNGSQIEISATVNSNESCNVTVTVTLPAGQSISQFPVPREATNVALSGNRVSTHTTEQAQILDISRAGLAFTVSYSLNDVVHLDSAGTPELQLPLLSGYALSSNVNFSVHLPDTIDAKPAFSSGYHHANIEKYLSVSVTGNTVHGTSIEELKDHETLTMTLDVEQTMFPDAPTEFLGSNTDEAAIAVCAVLALLYWLLFMRSLPPKRQNCAASPEGITAGQIGAVLTLSGADLSQMVFSWAQLGYLRIQNGKNSVVLHKAMEMGNERSAFEQRIFQKLFGKKSSVDTSGLNYAHLCRAVAKMSPNLQSLVQARSGNPKIFRALAALCCLFGGISFGITLSYGSALQGFWIFIIALLSALCGFLMQQPLRELLLRKSHKTVTGLIAAGICLLMGLSAGQFTTALAVMLLQWLFGFLAFYSGRRTPTGIRSFAQVLGLRQYLKTVPKDELRRIQESDPEYFHTLVPYALALGIGHSFAWRFGREPIADCPYIANRKEQSYTAWEWVDVMNKMLSAMNRRSQLLPIEKLLSLFSSGKR